MIIGVTGFLGAGNDTVADYLKQRSFYHISLSDMIREELRVRNIPENIPNLQMIANEMRAKLGSGILAERALARIEDDKHWIITSMRNPAEVEVFSKRKDFLLVFVDAPIDIRYQRVIARKRAGDIKSFEQFKKEEEAEIKGKANEQQLLKLRKMSHIIMNNNGTIKTFHEKIDKMLQDNISKHSMPRPAWDDYFMHITKAVARRANCMKRKVGAIIVKDRRIISTGYNGTPRGIKNCNEGGCKRCNSFAKSGNSLGECVCSHAEENAIVQSAYHGISIKDAVCYTTLSPCITCSKMIINAGIKKVVYNSAYPLGGEAQALLREGKVELVEMKVN
jgi:dCMP deaminase